MLRNLRHWTDPPPQHNWSHWESLLASLMCPRLFAWHVMRALVFRKIWFLCSRLQLSTWAISCCRKNPRTKSTLQTHISGSASSTKCLGTSVLRPLRISSATSKDFSSTVVSVELSPATSGWSSQKTSTTSQVNHAAQSNTNINCHHLVQTPVQ